MVANNRPKAFNCNVNKVTRADIYTVKSFNLHTLLNQSDDAPQRFVVTGTLSHNPTLSRDDERPSFRALWECLTEETVDADWIDRVLTPAVVLSLAGGGTVRKYGGDDGSRRKPVAANVPHEFRARPDLWHAVCRTRRHLRKSVTTDTAFSGDFLVWWECLARVGYDPRSVVARAAASGRRTALRVVPFVLDMRQTLDGNNFVPRVMCPPDGVLWDPYDTDDTKRKG